MMNRIAPPMPQVVQKQPKFGNIATMGPAILKAVDYASLGTSTVGQNMGIYGTVIASRLWKSRSPNEFWENARRDVLGWYNWFMGSPLIQTGLVLSLPVMMGKKGADAKRLMVSHLSDGMSFPQKVLKTLFAPNEVWHIASDSQLHQHGNQIMAALSKIGDKDQLAKVAKLFKATRESRAVISTIGLAYTFFALGVGIIWLNIFLTKLALKKEANKEPQPSSAKGPQTMQLTPAQLAQFQKLLKG